MKKDEIKAKSMIATIYTLAFVLYGVILIGLYYWMNITYPNEWYVWPSMFRGMTSSDAANYYLSKDWWWMMVGGIYAFGLIALPNAFYLLISKHRELEE